MKKSHNRKTPSIIVWALGLLGIGSLSTAYIDPGSGGFLIQALVASLLGAALLIRAFWGRITGLFGRKPKAPDETSDTEEPQ